MGTRNNRNEGVEARHRLETIIHGTREAACKTAALARAPGLSPEVMGTPGVGQGSSLQPPPREALGANSPLPYALLSSCCCFLVPCARLSPCLSQHTCQHQAGPFLFPQVQASSPCTCFQGASRKEQLVAEHHQLPPLFMIY